MPAWMLGDSVTAARAQLPARMRGLGIRSREHLAPAAYAACFIESAERFLDTTAQGVQGRGFFPMLWTAFGVGAFDTAYPASRRFAQFLSPVSQVGGRLTPSADALLSAWALLQAEVVGTGTAGPLDMAVDGAGSGRTSYDMLQKT